VWIAWLFTTSLVMARLPGRGERTASESNSPRKQDFPYVARASATAK